MRICKFEIDNFKSLLDFEIELPKFACLIGLNGSGKSTVLQAVDFVSHLVRGNVKDWLSQRRWKPSELKSKLSRTLNIDFSISLEDDNQHPLGTWQGAYSPTKNRCVKEKLVLPDYSLEIKSDRVFLTKKETEEAKSREISFDYQGSILSALREEILPPSVRHFKQLLREVKSLDLLSPEHLRQRTREAAGDIGLGGQNLSAFIHAMKETDREQLVAELRRVYPKLQRMYARPLRSGWKQMEIVESYQGEESGLFPTMTTESRHVNDGMLRLIAILAELSSNNNLLMFDEIENGINPELVEFVIGKLVDARQQVLVTTHSPIILNYLEDAVAKTGIIYLYKDKHGHTHSIPFFSIPSLAEKLNVMGPGEAFVDTNLTELAREIETITEGR
jgi:predicted ATPase